MDHLAYTYQAVKLVTSSLYEDIHSLESRCSEFEDIQLKLELDFKRQQATTTPDEDATLNEFLCYQGTKLVGYLGICSFSEEELEVNGMVDPNYRKQGIFTHLFSLADKEVQRRRTKKILLICDKNGAEGLRFIKQIPTNFHHAESDMYLQVMPNLLECSPFRIEVTEADPVNHRHVASFHGQPVGEVRLEVLPGYGGIYGFEIYEEYRGKKLGRELLLWAIHKLIEFDCRSIFLQVDQTNEIALNLYQSLNFKAINTLLYYELAK